ncbi:hypothetical protein OKA04_16690 [Luteolibacter flavescens]|uniref:Tripartite tricarboxylate transporter TctB family protein n=1 Tax=Luteolibacter flavescens TaxID=1859460 RepID=A0ABT3FS16_9BACT|nr:hypothetical protein [Luteolibacter flavescens]MCW1886377.1 hypothetical protein [Luteolibacter flavescens]
MKRETENTSPKSRPDTTLLAMIVSTGILIAWAYSTSRNSPPVDFRSGAIPIVPILLGAE